MEKILEWLKGIGKKIIDFWNRYTAKQKTVIISVVLAIFLALVLLTYFLSRPEYTQLATLETKVANDMVTALEEASIPYEVELISDDKTIISVEQSKLEEATMLIASNDNFSSEMTWEQAVDNGIDTTSKERQTKMRLALQNSIAQGLTKFDGVKSATVFIDQPEDDGTYAAGIRETSVSAILELQSGKVIDLESGKSMALVIANAAGCNTTDKIVIMDTSRNLIFNGENANSLGSAASDNTEFEKKLRNTISEDIRDILLKTGYSNVEVGTSNIVFDMDEVESLMTEYSVPEGRDEGPKKSDYDYNSKGTSGSGGVPGTDSNGDQTDYDLGEADSSNSETSLTKNEYAVNELKETRKKALGTVKKDESSLAVILTRYKTIREETLEEEGALDNISFDSYAEQNNQPTELDVTQETYDLISKNTGIATNNISIRAFEQPVFQSKESTGIQVTNYLMVILAVLIAALLVFVIVKGTSPVKVTELEPELSVEDLLASTAEQAALEEIELDEKSELRVLVDKFVDDNPEAVAALLRNWLNEDWD